MRRPPKAATSATQPATETFKISDAARMIGVEAYVLRFWETEFPFLRPAHTRSKHRVYAAKDIEILRLIKRLLHDERFTIAGAKRKIREVGIEQLLRGPEANGVDQNQFKLQAAPSGADDAGLRTTLKLIRRELQELHKMLEG